MERILFIFILILAITLVQTRKYKPKATITLTDGNFDRLVQNARNQKWFIVFQENKNDILGFKLETVAVNLIGTVHVALVETKKNPKIKARYQIKNTDQYKLLYNNLMYNYEGQLNINDIKKFSTELYKKQEVKVKMPPGENHNDIDIIGKTQEVIQSWVTRCVNDKTHGMKVLAGIFFAIFISFYVSSTLGDFLLSPEVKLKPV